MRQLQRTSPAWSGIAPAPSQVYVSYAWGDDLTPEGRAREAAVKALCDAAEARGVVVVRDRTALHAGDRIFVFLSDKYLRSAFCMLELFEIWRNSKQEDKAFLDRIRFYPLPDAKYRDWKDWIYWANFWKQQHDELDAAVGQHRANNALAFKPVIVVFGACVFYPFNLTNIVIKAAVRRPDSDPARRHAEGGTLSDLK